MNTRCGYEQQRLTQHSNPAIRAAMALLLLLPAAGWAGGVVTNCTEADMRAAMAGGGTVTFACDGTITLANTITSDVDTTLDGSGHQVTISGGKAVRVFQVNTNVLFTAANLTIANGASSNGAAIFNAGGTMNLLSTAFLTNVASAVLRGNGPIQRHLRSWQRLPVLSPGDALSAHLKAMPPF